MVLSLGELEVDHSPLPPGSASIEPAIHVEHNRQDRDPDHALPHPHQGAASRNRSARGKAQARTSRARAEPPLVAPVRGTGFKLREVVEIRGLVGIRQVGFRPSTRV